MCVCESGAKRKIACLTSQASSSLCVRAKKICSCEVGVKLLVTLLLLFQCCDGKDSLPSLSLFMSRMNEQSDKHTGDTCVPVACCHTRCVCEFVCEQKSLTVSRPCLCVSFMADGSFKLTFSPIAKQFHTRFCSVFFFCCLT